MRKLAMIAAASFILSSTSATAAVVTTSTINGSTSGYSVTGPTGNLCTGGGGISTCYATPTGTVVNGNPATDGSSPLIARIEGNENGTRGATDISSLFSSSVDGTEFTVNYDATANSLTFNYIMGTGDPTVHYLGISQASSYYLFYDVAGITSATINLTDLFPNNRGWSHLDVYDTGGPAVPEPATWAMMLIGFAGIGFSMRRRANVGRGQVA